MTKRKSFSVLPPFEFHTPVMDIRHINLLNSNKEVLDKQSMIQEIKAELAWYYETTNPPIIIIEPHDIPDVDLILIRTVPKHCGFTHSSDEKITPYESIKPILVQKVYSINILPYGDKRDEMNCNRKWATEHLIVNKASILRQYLINELYIEDIIEIVEKTK